MGKFFFFAAVVRRLLQQLDTSCMLVYQLLLLGGYGIATGSRCAGRDAACCIILR